MPRTSFRKLILRLSIAGAIILISFPLGIFAYLHTRPESEEVRVKNFQEAIDLASSHDTTILVGSREFIIKKGEVSGWTESYTRTYSRKPDVRFSPALDAYASELASKVRQEPVNARFTMTASGSVMILASSRTGKELDIPSAILKIRQGILANAQEIALDVRIVEPAITAETISSLGVNQRISMGESNFAGSSPARVQNIKVSSKLYNGHIIQPGEVFSFNTLLGDVDASTGYAPEKVIKNNRLEYEYGGGICQVSTTLFRAAMAAGFPIVERRNHAFPVKYYEPQGFDATIYPGSSDLRFKNDTKNPILIQTHTVGTKIIFELYGTGDGRAVAIDGPHQYDIQPDGAMKAYVGRTITYADGTTKTDRFNSTYKSPSLYPTQPNPYQ